jgi:GNAT superfamily N-acetyltransferase
MLTVRIAEPRDADAAVRVLRRSITELCVADHHNDPTTPQKWLENKTIENFHSWLATESNFCVVTGSNAEVNGVGLVHRAGEILLCYVAPESQGHGYGSAILAALEAKARTWGLDKLRLGSTVSARRFYERHGYISAGESTCNFGSARCYAYEKILQTNPAADAGPLKGGAAGHGEG